MNKYMEPWTHTWPDWIRTNDGSLVRTPKMVERIVTCVNACAGIPHPERLPGLMEAVRFVLDDVTRQALGDDTLPQVMAAVNDLRRAYAAMMGETP